jgi:hypothetical protein
MKPILCVFALVSLSACVNLPDVYLIDRHTVMEEEASGEWPELEARFREQAVKNGPTNLAKESMEQRRERAFRVLNGEFPVAKTDMP